MPPITVAVRALRSRLLLLPVLLAACDVHDATLLRQPEPSARLPASAADGGQPTMDAGSGVDADGCFQNPDPSGAILCPRVCPERCNGLDDDCDDRTDEDASGTCDADNAVAQCVDGACLIAECEPEFRDCDSRAETGCEVSIVDDPAHCGGCGLACAADRAQELLCRDDSSCVIATCSDGFGDCDLELDNGCETLVRTLEDCGGCASRGEAAPCSDLPNATASDCDTGRCRIMECAPGFIDCDGIADNGCEEADGPGACGCDETDPTDSDDDGEPDCTDRCDDDPDKTEEGACGCGSADTDSDQDGSADCIDLCDDDPAKQEPGSCGCGVPEGDRDGDGTPDCDDGCPGDDRTTDSCFGGWHSNFDDRALDFGTGGSGVLDCGETRIDTTAAGGQAIATFDNWCGPSPAVSVSAQQGGPELVVIALRELRVASGATLLVVGDRPLAFAVRGDVDIDGTVDASASGSTAGAGGDLDCGNAAGGDGAGSPGRWGQDPQAGASGGGGGGFASAGGPGGTADTDRNGSATTNQGTPGGGGGATRGNASLVPLVGGCPGGRAGGCSAAPGAGGGALQISASGTLRATGSLRARGGDGSTPCGGSDEGGGTGGGSGGALLLEAGSLDLGGASIHLGGGRGGSNGSYAGIYNCGASGGGAGSGNTSSPGQPGVSCQGGSSGGGGGHGRLQTREGAN